MIKQILKSLNDPFPSSSGYSDGLLYPACTAIFVTSFLMVFQPFGLHLVDQNFTEICIGFGGVTFLVGLSYWLFCKYVLKINTHDPKWTLWKWIVYVLVMVQLIAIGNFLFLMLAFPGAFNTPFFFFWTIKATFILWVIPIVITGLLIQLRANEKNTALAAMITSTPKANKHTCHIKLKFERGDSIELSLADLLYIEAMQNYVVIHYQSRNGVKKCVLRGTISSAEKQLEGSAVVRCHRSFLVNTLAITHVTGNAQGLQLTLNSSPYMTVPVSRTHIETFSKALQS